MIYSTVLRIFINVFLWSGTAHNWRRGEVKPHVNLKRWLCHVVRFDLYLVTFKPNYACLFYYWPERSFFNRQVRCFFMKLCCNSICYKQDSQLFTRYAVSASNNLSMKSADSANLQDEINCSTSRRLFSYKMNLSTNLNFFKMFTLER